MTDLEQVRAARVDQALKDIQSACSHLRCVSIGLERIDPLEEQGDEVAELADRCEAVARVIVKYREEIAVNQRGSPQIAGYASQEVPGER